MYGCGGRGLVRGLSFEWWIFGGRGGGLTFADLIGSG